MSQHSTFKTAFVAIFSDIELVPQNPCYRDLIVNSEVGNMDIERFDVHLTWIEGFVKPIPRYGVACGMLDVGHEAPSWTEQGLCKISLHHLH